MPGTWFNVFAGDAGLNHFRRSNLIEKILILFELCGTLNSRLSGDKAEVCVETDSRAIQDLFYR